MVVRPQTEACGNCPRAIEQSFEIMQIVTFTVRVFLCNTNSGDDADHHLFSSGLNGP